jgi:hypothetical protein
LKSIDEVVRREAPSSTPVAHLDLIKPKKNRAVLEQGLD